MRPHAGHVAQWSSGKCGFGVDSASSVTGLSSTSELIMSDNRAGYGASSCEHQLDVGNRTERGHYRAVRVCSGASPDEPVLSVTPLCLTVVVTGGDRSRL